MAGPLGTWIRRILATVALLVIFVAALAAGLIAHVNAPVARRLAEQVAARVLTDTFVGAVAVEGVDQLGVDGFEVRRLALRDAEGRQVLELARVTVSLDLVQLLGRVFAGGQKFTVVVQHVRAESATVLVTPDDHGRPSLESALTPVAATAPDATPEGGGRDVRVWVPVIEVGEASGSVDVADVPSFSGRVVGVRGRVLVAPQGVAVDVERFGAALVYQDGTEARGTGTLAIRAPGPVRGSFEGFLGDVEIQARVAVLEDHLDAEVSLPGVTPRAARQFLPEWPIEDRVSGRVSAKGNMDRLEITAALDVGSGHVEATGTAVPSRPPRADLEIQATHLDLRSLFPDAPQTDLAVAGRVRFEDRDGKGVFSLEAASEPTTIADQAVPAADFQGTLVDGRLSGTATLHEPGVPLSARVEVTPDGTLELDIDAPSFDLARIERADLPLAARGSARMQARLQGGHVEAAYQLRLRDVRRDGFSAETLIARGSAVGSLEELAGVRIEGTASGTNLGVGRFSFETAEGRYSGRWPDADVSVTVGTGDTLTGSGRGKVRLAPTVTLRDLELAVTDGPVRATGRASYVDPAAGAFDVEHFVVEGLGGPVEGSLRFRPELLETQLRGENVDLGELSRRFALPLDVKGGRMRVDADVTIGHDVTRARVKLGVGNTSVAGISGLSFEVQASLDDRRFQAEGSGIVENVGVFGSRASGSLAGSPLVADSWLRATGTGDLTLSDLNLPLLPLLLGEGSPVAHVDGRAYARINVERSNPSALPYLSVTATTRGLVLSLRPGEDGTSTTLRGIDVHTTATLAGPTGEASGTVLLTDDVGDLCTATGLARLDLDALRAAPERWGSAFAAAPLDVRVRLPPRALSALPPPIRPDNLDGQIDASVQVRGSIASPQLHVKGAARGVVAPGSRTATPVDIELDGQLDPNAGQLDLGARALVAGRVAARAEGHARREGGLWQGRTDLEIDGLPVTALPPLADADLRGDLYGAASLERVGARRHLEVDLEWKRAAIGRSPVDDGRLRIVTREEEATVDLELASAAGRLVTHATIPVDWASPVPSLRYGRPAKGTLTARRFDAAALGPLLGDTFRRVGGVLDADARLEATLPGPRQDWRTTVNGRATLRRGTLLIQPLGMDVQGASFDATVSTKGQRVVVTLDDVRARVRSDEPNVTGSATFELAGLSLDAATTDLRVEDLPLLYEGVSQGRATGSLHADLTRREDHMLVEVDIPEMLTVLPRTSSRNVVDLQDNQDVTILQKPPEAPSDEVTPWQFILRLGDAVRVKQADLDLGIRGSPIIELGVTTNVYGSIELVPGGRATVIGHVFSVESGSLIFDTGEADNPRLDITATWRAPTDAIITVAIDGTFDEPLIRFSSEPALTETEIFALLLGGPSTDGGSESDTTATGQAAGERGLGSGVAAIGNQILGDSPVELRVSTTSDSRPRYTAAVRVGQNLWFEASTYDRPTVGAGDSAVFSGTIDYRFTRRWSLRTEVGTAGGVADLLWQYRY